MAWFHETRVMTHKACSPPSLMKSRKAAQRKRPHADKARTDYCSLHGITIFSLNHVWSAPAPSMPIHGMSLAVWLVKTCDWSRDLMDKSTAIGPLGAITIYKDRGRIQKTLHGFAEAIRKLSLANHDIFLFFMGLHWSWWLLWVRAMSYDKCLTPSRIIIIK